MCSSTSASSLAETMRSAFEDHDATRVRGMAARSLYERSYLLGEVTRSLLEIYEGLERTTASGATNRFRASNSLYGEDLGNKGVTR